MEGAGRTDEGVPEGGTPNERARSRPPEDLSREPLLRHATPIDFEDGRRPSVGKRFALLAKLGRGGMGVVYYGVHVRLSTEVAVKLLPFSLQGQEDALVRRFEREARIAAALRSPHLVEVVDIDHDEATRCHFIVMEYVAGASADRILDMHRGGLPEIDALDLCIAATKGLVAAHLEGVVHRDIKPSNVLVPGDAERRPLYASAKLADLGLARRDDAGAEEPTLTATHVPIGTPGYMAPEQTVDARHAKKPADVFSMGATLYALLSGQAPFSGADLLERLQNTRLGRRPPIRQLRPDVSGPTASLVERCLELDAERRFTDAPALLAALELCRTALATNGGEDMIETRLAQLSEQPEQGKRVVTPSPSAEPPPIPTPSSAAASRTAPVTPTAPLQPAVHEAPPGARRSRGLVVALAVVALVAVGALVATLYSRADGERPAGPPARPTATETAPAPKPPAPEPPAAKKPAEVSPAEKKPAEAPPAPPPFDPVEDLRALVAEFQSAQRARDPARMNALGDDILPTDADLAQMVVPGPTTDVFLANRAKQTEDGLRTGPEVGLGLFQPGDATRTQVHVFAATTEQLGHGDPAGAQFPGGMKRFADIAVLGRTWYVVELRAPGKSSGINFATFTRVGERWVFLWKPWRFMPSDEPPPPPPPSPPTTGTLRFARLPSGTAVSLSDRALSDGDALPAGEHVLRLARDGFRPQDARVQVVAGADAFVTATQWERSGLRILWRKGAEFTVETRFSERGRLRAGDEESTSAMTKETTVRVQVASVDAAGAATLRWRHERVAGSRTDVNGDTASYDSAAGTGEKTDVDIVGKWLQAKVSAEGEVTESSSGGWCMPRESGKTFSAADTGRSVESTLIEFLPRYSAGKERPGDAWTDTFTLFDAGMTTRATRTWSIASASTDEAELEMSARYEPTAGKVEGLEEWVVDPYASKSTFVTDLASGLPASISTEASFTLRHDMGAVYESANKQHVTWRRGAPVVAPAPPPQPEPEKRRPPPAEPSGGVGLAGAYSGATQACQLPDGTFAFEVPSGWAITSQENGLTAFDGGVPGGQRDLAVLVYYRDLDETQSHLSAERLLELELAGLKKNLVLQGIGTLDSFTRDPHALALAGDPAAEAACLGTWGGSPVTAWIGARRASPRFFVVIGIEPRSRGSGRAIAGAKRMLLSARVPPRPSGSAVASAIAGRRFGNTSFYSSGSMSTIYEFGAGGAVSLKTLTSFSGVGGSESTKRGRYQIVDGSVRMTFDDGDVEEAEVETNAGGVSAIRIGRARYPVL